MKLYALLSVLVGSNVLAESQTVAKSVKVTDLMRACSTTHDCVKVETLCSACCGVDVINKSELAKFNSLYAETCKNHSGAVCDCAPEPTRVFCMRGLCTLRSMRITTKN